ELGFLDERADELLVLRDRGQDALDRDEALEAFDPESLGAKHLGHAAGVDPLEEKVLAESGRLLHGSLPPARLDNDFWNHKQFNLLWPVVLLHRFHDFYGNRAPCASIVSPGALVLGKCLCRLHRRRAASWQVAAKHREPRGAHEAAEQDPPLEVKPAR